MQETIKRLELIKSAITLEEVELVSLQIPRIVCRAEDTNLELILTLLKNGEYSGIIEKIDRYIQSLNGVVLHEDRTILELKFEIRQLEKILQELSAEYIEAQALIARFNREYSRHVGDILEKVLYLRSQILSSQAQCDSSKNSEYEEAQREYEEYSRIHDEIQKDLSPTLTEDETALLKKLYRRACVLCHPDKVSEEFRQQAHELFIQLNEAYNRCDLERVTSILDQLEKSGGFEESSESLSDTDRLRARIQELKSKIDLEKSALDGVIHDETYLSIISITNWNSYFTTVKIQLTEECSNLEKMR